ncbi:GNAT family N-acetyltransferase [uncultured Demequina sp.]|uniref:GNAT family N-acetyltransferase n=1 Tax=uncultured Demequina sp. TaxID=693499 RepID=UPI0025D4101B|nr:GNAT family N-acetyltransferase [uncultured Demequina sp.]
MTETTWNADAARYELRVDGTLVGWIDTRSGDGILVMTHTEVLEDFRGRGLSKPLIEAALEDAVRQELAVAPLCPAVARYVDRHDTPGLRIVGQ